jgi:hypothetical protein
LELFARRIARSLAIRRAMTHKRDYRPTGVAERADDDRAARVEADEAGPNQPDPRSLRLVRSPTAE